VVTLPPQLPHRGNNAGEAGDVGAGEDGFLFLSKNIFCHPRMVQNSYNLYLLRRNTIKNIIRLLGEHADM